MVLVSSVVVWPFNFSTVLFSSSILCLIIQTSLFNCLVKDVLQGVKNEEGKLLKGKIRSLPPTLQASNLEPRCKGTGWREKGRCRRHHSCSISGRFSRSIVFAFCFGRATSRLRGTWSSCSHYKHSWCCATRQNGKTARRDGLDETQWENWMYLDSTHSGWTLLSKFRETREFKHLPC